MPTPQSEVHDILATINTAWRNGRPSAMSEHLHPGVTMVLPGFGGIVEGRDALLEGFAEFCANARVLEYRETDEQIQVVGNVAVASFRFIMEYERSTYRERSTGRDVWVFERAGGQWNAVWRTMLELEEKREAKK